MKPLIVILFAAVLLACSGLPGTSGEQGLAITPSVEAIDSTVKVTTETNQEQDISSGAKVKADIVETITTENNAGIPVWWFMVGCLVFGLIIPQPFFVRWLF